MCSSASVAIDAVVTRRFLRSPPSVARVCLLLSIFAPLTQSFAKVHCYRGAEPVRLTVAGRRRSGAGDGEGKRDGRESERREERVEQRRAVSAAGAAEEEEVVAFVRVSLCVPFLLPPRVWISDAGDGDFREEKRRRQRMGSGVMPDAFYFSSLSLARRSIFR